MAKPIWFDIRVHKSTEWIPTVAVGFFKSLADTVGNKAMHLEMIAQQDGIHFTVTSPALTEQHLLHLVQAFYPHASVLPFRPNYPNYPFYRSFTVFSRLSRNYFDYSTLVSSHRSFDPLIAVAQTLGNLHAGEFLTYSISIGRFFRFSPKDIEQALTMSAKEAGVGGTRPFHMPTKDLELQIVQILGSIGVSIINDIQRRRTRVLRYSDAETERYLTKLQQTLAQIDGISVSLSTPHKHRMEAVTAVTGAVASLVQADAPVRLKSGDLMKYRVTNAQDDEAASTWQHTRNQPSLFPYQFVLTADELATFWHLPHTGFHGIPIAYADAVPQEVLIVGKPATIPIGSVIQGGAVNIALSRYDRQYHSFISGQVGMGKSTLLHNLIHADIQAGEGVCVIDPHGSLIQAVLEKSIPPNRLDDVVYLECRNKDYPIPLNPFRVPEGVDQEAVFSSVLWIMRSLYASNWSAGRLETIMRNVLQIVLADPDATPLDIQRLFLDSAYRTELVGRLEERDVLSRSGKNFWLNFDELSDSDQRQQVQPVLNRLAIFLGSTHLERMFCHPHTIDYRALMREKKIVLIDLSGDIIASEIAALGAMFFTNFFLASHALFVDEDKKVHPFYLYVDEAERFITNTLENIFAEARKFGLWLTVVCQYIGQFDASTQSAIKGTVGTKISFECSFDEAKSTGRLYEPEIEPTELTRLGKGRVAIKTRISGATLPPFLMYTRPEPAPVGDTISADLVKQRSLENLGLLSAEEIKQWLAARYDAAAPPAVQTRLKDFE